MSDDSLEEFDQVVQMQLSEFQRHILGATNADLCIVIIEVDGVAQVATGSTVMSENEGKGRSAALIAQVADAMVVDMSEGRIELMIRDKKTGEVLPTSRGYSAKVMKA